MCSYPGLRIVRKATLPPVEFNSSFNADERNLILNYLKHLGFSQTQFLCVTKDEVLKNFVYVQDKSTDKIETSFYISEIKHSA